MVRDLLTKNIRLVHFLLLAMALGTIAYAAFLIEDNSPLQTTLFSIGAAVASTTLLSLFHSALGVDVPTLVRQSLEFQQQLYDIGLMAITMRIGDDSVFQKLDSAHTVDMMYNTAKNTSYRYGGLITQVVGKRGGNVRILVSNPENPYWDVQAVKDGLCPGTNIPNEIRDVINYWQLQIDSLKSQNPYPKSGSIELRTYPCSPTGSIFIVDDTVRYISYLPYTHSSEVPSFDATYKRGGKLYETYKHTFERVWQHATPVLDVKFS